MRTVRNLSVCSVCVCVRVCVSVVVCAYQPLAPMQAPCLNPWTTMSGISMQPFVVKLWLGNLYFIVHKLCSIQPLIHDCMSCIARCAQLMGNSPGEAESWAEAARLFLKAEAVYRKSRLPSYEDGINAAIHCFLLAIQVCVWEVKGFRFVSGK